MIKKWNNPSIKFGLIGGLLLIGLIVFWKSNTSINLGTQKILGFLAFIIFIFSVLQSIVASKALIANQKWTTLFAAGFKTTAVIVCIISLFVIIGLKLNPSIKEKEIALFKQQSLALGRDVATIDKELKPFKDSYTALKLGGLNMILLPCGLIFSLLGAITLSKKNIK
jgi:predicted ferric reductase